MSGETKKSNRFRKNIKKNWKEITMANIIDDETIEYVGILAKLALSEEEKEQAKKDMSDMLDYIDMLGELEETLANAPEQKNGAFKVPKTV